MRTIYILRDTDPMGGLFCGQDFAPDMEAERPTIVEVRVMEMQDETWSAILAGSLPIDVDGSNDTWWAGFFSEAAPFWPI